METVSFLNTLYGDTPGLVALWRLDTKATIWIDRVAEPWKIDEFVAAAKKKPFDAYFAICLQKEKLAARNTNESAFAVPGFWSDIDFADKPNDEGKKRTKVYPPPEVAESVLSKMPVAPSLRVKTGGGIHVYWLFDKPFIIKSKDDNARIADLVKRWHGLLTARLIKAGGYGIDSTFDLGRVLRLPGTPHTKHAGRLVAVDPPIDPAAVGRYKLADLEAFINTGSLPGMVTAPPAATNGAKKTAAKKATPPTAAPPKPEPTPAFYANEQSEPPAVKLYNLAEFSPGFKKLWDGKETKPSPSEYDMALANYAINAGWTDQEAAALLVAFSKRYHPDHLPKLLRVTGGVQDYLKLTIGKAHDKRRVDAKSESSNQAIEELAIEVRAATEAGRDPSRDLVLSAVSKALGVEVIGFRQTGRRDEVYSLVIKQGGAPLEVVIGNAAAIHAAPDKLCQRLMAEAGRYVAVTKKLRGEWGSIVASLISIREFYEVREAELADRVRAIIEEHLSRNAGGFYVESPESRAKAVIASKPYIEEAKLHISAPALKRLASEIDRGIAGNDLYIGLRQLHFEQQTIQVPQRRTSKSYWIGSTDGFTIAAPPDNSLPANYDRGGRAGNLDRRRTAGDESRSNAHAGGEKSGAKK